MSVECKPPARHARRPRVRRTSADRLRDALLTMCDHRGQMLSHTKKAWASITFAGTRHSMSLPFAGEEAVEAGKELIAALPDQEFAIAGQLVADAGVSEVGHRIFPDPRLVVHCALLQLEDA